MLQKKGVLIIIKAQGIKITRDSEIENCYNKTVIRYGTDTGFLMGEKIVKIVSLDC